MICVFFFVFLFFFFFFFVFFVVVVFFFYHVVVPCWDCLTGTVLIGGHNIFSRWKIISELSLF